jgi:malonyl-CoA O-methyltransferase
MTGTAATPLPARDGYRLWAPTYGDENPTTALDVAAVRKLSPSLAGTAVLDAGCGTGCRLPAVGRNGPRAAVGIDLVPDMVRRGKERACDLQLAVADVQALPFDDHLFDVVWCRLVIGYVADLGGAYHELGRVTRPGGCVIVTDFHPAAARAGLTRSFRDAAGVVHVLENHVHEPPAHRDAAARAGLAFDVALDQVVGPLVRPFYEAARMLDRYEQQRGLPLVLALRFTR